MDENATKIIKDKFDSLPKSIQEVILSSNYENSLVEIGKQYNLNVEQLSILERETTLVMMGLTPVQNFPTELTRELSIDRVKIDQIVKDLNEKIFLKIRELLKLINTPPGEKSDLSDEKENPDENQVLDSAGIKFTVPAQSGIVSKKEAAVENREELLNKIEKPELIAPIKQPLEIESAHPVLAKKLSEITQTQTVKTEHTLENITKISTLPQKPPSGGSEKAGYKADPYREIPE